MKITQILFNQILKKNFLFENNPIIAVAVSGGPDSMALVFLLNKWIKKKEGKIIALIVDHGLRLESNKESKLIKNYLSTNKIQSKIFVVNKNKIIKKNMNEARENRFDRIIKYCSQNGILHLFIGHHFDDNLETFLLRKTAGSNFEGLRSMQMKSFMGSIQILKPFLSYRKKNILDYLNKNNIYYIDDPSNYSKKYTRVIIRNFLHKDSNYFKQVQKDFEKIIYYYPFYKTMIYQIFNYITFKIENNNVLISANKFYKYDNEVKIKIIEIIFKFLFLQKKFLRHKKILNIVNLLNHQNLKNTNLAGMHIKKDLFLISFSK